MRFVLQCLEIPRILALYVFRFTFYLSPLSYHPTLITYFTNPTTSNTSSGWVLPFTLIGATGRTSTCFLTRS